MGKVLRRLHERHNFEDLIGAKAEFKIEQRKYVAMSEHPRLLAFQNYTLQDIKDHEARVQAWHRAWDSIKTRASGDEHISDIILKTYQPRPGPVDLDEDVVDIEYLATQDGCMAMPVDAHLADGRADAGG